MQGGGWRTFETGLEARVGGEAPTACIVEQLACERGRVVLVLRLGPTG